MTSIEYSLVSPGTVVRVFSDAETQQLVSDWLARSVLCPPPGLLRTERGEPGRTAQSSRGRECPEEGLVLSHLEYSFGLSFHPPAATIEGVQGGAACQWSISPLRETAAGSHAGAVASR
jgi:hypothetical protein